MKHCTIVLSPHCDDTTCCIEQHVSDRRYFPFLQRKKYIMSDNVECYIDVSIDWHCDKLYLRIQSTSSGHNKIQKLAPVHTK